MRHRLLLSSVVVLLLMLASEASVSAAPNPVITGVSPSSGTVLGGTAITISGADFQLGATVFVGGSSADSVVVESSTKITAITPRGNIGSAMVLVRNPDGGGVTLNGGYFFTAVASDLTVTSLSAASGSVRGGTLLTLTGTGFSGSTVLVGGAPAASVNVMGPSSISLRTPPGVPGPVSVMVRNSDGVSVTLANAFTYAPGAPEIVSITPGGGLTSGGAVVQIGGYAFAPGSRVLFGGVEARDVLVVNSTLITATSPVAASGTVDVRVVRPDGASATLNNAFTYRATASAPGVAISGLTTTSGASVGGTRLEVQGTGFSGGATVYFGNAPANVLSIPGPSTITLTTPPNVAGTVPVTVVNSDGSSVTLTNGFRYEGGNGVVVTGVEPRTGGAGTVIAVRGAAFANGAMVSVNGVSASNVWVVSDGLAYATVPSGSGAAAVTVTNFGGPSATLANAFTYEGGASAPPSTPPPASGTPTALPARGFGLFVFAGGANTQLVASVSCSASTLTFWATNAAGEFDTYVPGVSIAAVNAGWNARFPNGIPASTPLIGRCQS